jgi:hypothetical protein
LLKNSILLAILGGAALQRCDNCIVLNAALAAEGAALAQKRLFPQPVRSYLLQIPKTELLSPARVPEREGPWRLDCATHLFSGKDDWPGSCERIGMILLVTSSVRAAECAAALNQATGERVVVAESLPRATTLLRAECYLAVVLDQYLLEADPREAEATLAHLGTAIPVQVNLGISGMERLVREVREAGQRRQREEAGTRKAVISRMYGELNGTVTALLLSSELALETPGLPVAAAEKIESVHELVKKLRRQLESGGATEERKQAAGA